VDGLNVGVAKVSPGGKILYANSSFLVIFGIAPHRQLQGVKLAEFIASRSWDSMYSALEMALDGPVDGEIKVSTIGEKPRTLRLSLSPLGGKQGPTIRIVAAEVTEVVATNQVLQETEGALRSLSARILQLQDQERRKIARDLHDTAGQELAVLVMSLKHLADSADRSGLDVRRGILEAIELARKVNDEIRTLSYLLHPPLLDEFGLGSALQWFVEGFGKRSGIAVTLAIPEKIQRFSSEKETALFRLVQEGLTNVMRHSGSQIAKIVVCAAVDEIEVTVEDQGKGMEGQVLDRLIGSSQALGVGIPGLRERLRQLGGKLEISSGPSGTRVIARVPLEEPDSPVNALYKGAELPEPGYSPKETLRKRILVVDDHELMRRGIRGLLDKQPDLEICGEANNGADAVQKTLELSPDLVILDLAMPGAGGLSAASQIRHSGCDTKILVFTTHSFPGIEGLIRSAGCNGMVLKSFAGQDLVRAARVILSGGQFYKSAAIETKAQTA
jgi:signal transduction histidine kinase/AmiR/NasT family two-component response regulator